MPMRPGMTRCIIWPSVSRVFSGPPRPWRSARPPLDISTRLRSWNAWKLVITIFARSRSPTMSAGTSSLLA